MNPGSSLGGRFNKLPTSDIVRILGLLLLATISSSVQAQFAFTTNDGTLTITGYAGSERHIDVPGTINGFVVTRIADHAFEGRDTETEITLPNSIVSLGDSAFSYCLSVTNITMPDSLTNIGASAFYGCLSLSNLTIPDRVTSIGAWAFAGCSSLTNIAIPASATSIGSDAFGSCNNLTAITVAPGNPSYSSVDGVLFNKDQTTIIKYPCGKRENLALASSVSKIEARAFSECRNLANITIPNTVTNIGKDAFKSCSALTSITIPQSVTRLENTAFKYCGGLTNVTILSKITNIGDGMFYSCSNLANVVLPESVTTIGYYAFENCSSLTNITIPNGVTNIDRFAFFDCSSLTSLTIPGSVAFVGDKAFARCVNLTEIRFMGNPPNVGSDLFEDSLPTVYYQPGAVGWGSTFEGRPTHLAGGESPFVFANNEDGTLRITGYRGPVSEITIPSTLNGVTVTSIGEAAFSGCSTLVNVRIPATVSSVAINAFWNCESLSGITVDAANEFFSSTNGMLFDKNQSTLITCPAGKDESIIIPTTVTNIADYAFRDCTGVTRIFFKGDAPSVGSEAFLNCVPSIYYLPGAVGWDSPLAGYPIILWNPAIQPVGLISGTQTFKITGTPGIPVVVEASSSLADQVWNEQMTATLANGIIEFSDPASTNSNCRFYRVRSP